MSRRSEYSSTKATTYIHTSTKRQISRHSSRSIQGQLFRPISICKLPRSGWSGSHEFVYNLKQILLGIILNTFVRKTYSIIIFSAFICSGFFSPRIGEVTFIVGDGVAMEVGVARFIGIDIDEDMGRDEVAGRSNS